MNNGYIEKKRFIKNLKYNFSELAEFSIYDFIDMVDDEPIEDVTPVVHAHWKDTGKEMSVCTSCKSYWVNAEDKYEYNYCPNCGAKMDEVRRNTNELDKC